ncbi:hypothetical protein F8S13_25525 [Chloroflexia bacterium SDU3-3]|nr:hypothetical protein F8S13_25525 [Chloroflexia bacterium SDU3-3]
MPNPPMPSFRAIRAAILDAPPRPQGFPLDALCDGARLRTIRAAPHLRALLADIRAESARAQAEPPEPLGFELFRRFGQSGDRAAFERAYFDRRRRLLGLSLAAAVDGDDTPLPALADLLWEICGEYSWALPAHLPLGPDEARASRTPPEQVVDLFAAHTAHALAEVLALLGERLDPWLHYRIRAEVEQRVFQPLFHDPHHFKWEWEPINWAAVCGGCAGMAALVLEDDRERLAGMVDRVVRALECFLEGFGDDGGCAEGIGYWAYGFGFYTYFADALRQFTGGALDLMQGQKLRQIAAFPGAVSLGGDAAVNYSDADPRVAIHPGLGSYLAARFATPMPALAEPTLAHDHIFRWGNTTRDLLWTDPAALHAPVGSGTFFLPDLAWVVDRRVVGGEVLAFSAKGGHNDEPHNHNDLGHFLIHVGGESLLADLGAGVYTRQYFREQRYEHLHTGSHGHSLPLLNGQPQRAGRAHAAHVLACEPHPDGLRLALDLTSAYDDPTLRAFTRSFGWTASGGAATLDLADCFDFAQPPAALEERFVSLRRPALSEGCATWSGERGDVTMHFDAGLFAPSVEELATHTHQGQPITVFILRLLAQGAGAAVDARFQFACRLA